MATAIVEPIPQLHVEQIGSTTVPGCEGKGIVDLAVLYLHGGLDQACDRLRSDSMLRRAGAAHKCEIIAPAA